MQPQSDRLLLGFGADDTDHRGRLLEGMALAVSEKPYGEVTIADVVRLARVSKRTFYEQFPDKEACFLATYTAIASELLGRIAEAARGAEAGEAQLSCATEAYFSALEQRQPLMRAFLSEVHAAGPAALALRRDIHTRFAQLLCGLVARARCERPDVRELSLDLSLALVGGINELILHHMSADGGSLTPVRRAALELFTRVLQMR